MKCTKCGFEFDEGLFCPECGAKYDEEEAKRIENEALEQEKIRKEEEKKEEEEKKRKEEEEKAQRELELEKVKVEQERLAVEKAAHEAELLRQQNERIRIEQENKVKAEEQEKKHQEELSRTFNGIIYNSVDEMNIAKTQYDEQMLLQKNIKKANAYSVWSLILSIATYPLVFTFILWFPSLIVSIVLGVTAIKKKSEKRGMAIASFIINGIFILICILCIVLPYI